MPTERAFSIRYRFEVAGTLAPAPPPRGQIWVDLGGRLAPRVIDHHGGDISVGSASELALGYFKKLILKVTEGQSRFCLVLHHDPDLDAICAAWLITKILEERALPEPSSSYEKIVRSVTKYDRGRVRAARAESSWPIVMRTVLATDGGQSDRSKLFCGFSLLNASLDALKAGRDLRQISRAILTPKAKASLQKAGDDYRRDLRKARILRVRLPLKIKRERGHTPLGPIDPPDPRSGPWRLADGIYLDNPTCALFKELARGDLAHSPAKRGFALLVVSRPAFEHGTMKRRRYIISVDPGTKFYLRGLGDLLEKAEQAKEHRSRIPLPPGRRRVPWGRGRFGYNVLSPWYDGRGHGFTIVDSPRSAVGGPGALSSRLSPREVLKIVESYGAFRDSHRLEHLNE
jgi:hypothetical protein